MPSGKSKRSKPSKADPATAESFDALRRRESARNGLVRLYRRHAAAALHRIEHPRKIDRTEDIHQVRVQCKRMRAILRLLKPAADTEALARENTRLRDAARRLSSYRDAYVAGETLKRIFEDAAPARMGDAARLLGVKRRPHKDMGDLDSALKEAAKSLRRSADAFRELVFSRRGWASIEPGLEDSYRRARKEYHRCLDRGHGHLGDCFHAWRKRVKDLAYQLEILENLPEGVIRKSRKDVRRLGALLGEDHDYIVFAEHVREREKHYLNLANFRPVRKRLKRRLKALRAKEFALSRVFFADKPRVWVARLAETWRHWKNPEGAPLVLTIESPGAPPTAPRSLGATQLDAEPVPAPPENPPLSPVTS